MAWSPPKGMGQTTWRTSKRVTVRSYKTAGSVFAVQVEEYVDATTPQRGEIPSGCTAIEAVWSGTLAETSHVREGSISQRDPDNLGGQ